MDWSGSRTLFLSLCCILLLPGCDDRRRHQPSQAIHSSSSASPIAADAAPDVVARAMLQALAKAQEARAHGLGAAEHKRAYDQALGEIYALAAKTYIHDTAASSHSPTLPRDVSEEAALTVVSESWMSLLAHYSAGIRLDTLQVLPANPLETAVALCEAENPTDRQIVSEIESSLPKNSPGNSTSQPTGRSSSEYAKQLRSKALSKGVNIPSAARVELDLRRVDGSWRVGRVTLGARLGRLTHSQPQAQSQPAV